MKKTNELSARKVAQMKELVKELCSLLGGRFVSEVADSDNIRDNERRKTGIQCRETDGDPTSNAGLINKERAGIQCRTTAKKEAFPERAWELLERARDGGLLGEDWRPMCSLTEAALLAQMISFEVWGGRRWKPFEELWGVKRLCKSFDKATFLKKMPSVEKRIGDILQI